MPVASAVSFTIQFIFFSETFIFNAAHHVQSSLSFVPTKHLAKSLALATLHITAING